MPELGIFDDKHVLERWQLLRQSRGIFHIHDEVVFRGVEDHRSCDLAQIVVGRSRRPVLYEVSCGAVVVPPEGTWKWVESTGTRPVFIRTCTYCTTDLLIDAY